VIRLGRGQQTRTGVQRLSDGVMKNGKASVLNGLKEKLLLGDTLGGVRGIC
jgi:hypothetical protein